MAAFYGTLNTGLNRENFIIFKVRRLQKNVFGRIALIHPRNDMENWQTAPTSGTSFKGGWNRLFFFIQSSSIIYNFIPPNYFSIQTQ